MSESEFEFEDDEFDSFYEGEDTTANTSSQQLNIENTYYEAEDKINQDPEGAAKRLYELKSLLAACNQEGALSLPKSVVQGWQVKVLRSLLKIPSEDFRSRCRNLGDLLCVLDVQAAAETTNLIVTGLDAVEHSLRSPISEEDLTLYLGLIEAVCEVANKASTPRLWQHAGLQVTRILIENARYEQAETWLSRLYAQWMEVTLSPTSRIWDTPHFLKRITASTSEDAHLLEIIALDFELCENTNVEWRKRRLINYCENVSRVMINRRTTIRLKTSIAEYYFKRGAYSAAYPNLYDAWEANFSLGNTETAQKQLADLVLCNILCASPIDPLSTREAQTLETKQKDGAAPFEEISLKDVLCTLRTLRSAVSTNDVRQILEIFDTPAMQVFLRKSRLTKGAPIKRVIVYEARRRRYLELIKLWSVLSMDFLARELAYENLTDLQLFVIGMSDYLPPATNTCLIPNEGLVEVFRRDSRVPEQESLLKSIHSVSANLNISNLSAF